MSTAASVLLAVGVPAGAALGAAYAELARRIPDPGQPLYRLQRRTVRRVGARWETRWEPAHLAGATVPVAAYLFVPGPGAVLAAAVGWLLLGIAVCDERTLRIPHLLWAAGIVAGLAAAGSVAGWSGVAARVGSVAVLECGLLVAAYAARRLGGRAPVGAADYGVLAALGAVCGPWVALDVLLVGGVLALGAVASGAAPPERRTRAALLAACATAAGMILGVAGAAMGAALLALSATSSARAGRELGPAPFGACLAAGALCVILAGALAPVPAAEAVRGDIVLRQLRSLLP